VLSKKDADRLREQIRTAKIEIFPIEELMPHPKNSRVHEPWQIAKVAASIKEMGFTNPCLVKEDGTILAGHCRVQAALKLELTEIPCIVLKHLTPTQERALLISDNQLALISSWDEGVLSVELQELNLDPDFDLTLLGFDQEKMDELLGVKSNPGNEGNGDPDAIPPDAPTRCKPGDIWQLGDHRLMCGDSTNAEHVERLMAGEKADMVFTDPPYGVDYSGGHNEKKRDGIKNDALVGTALTDLFAAALGQAVIHTADHAAFYIWYANGKAVETFASFSRLPLRVRAVLCWYKVRSGLGAFMSQYIPNYEPCIYAFKDGCSPQWFGPTDEKTVWELPKERVNEFHPTQKPVDLGERAIRNSSQAGHIVMDLFLGSGSTVIACEKTGRRCFGMELDPKFCDVILKRWEDFSGKKSARLGDEASGVFDS